MVEYWWVEAAHPQVLLSRQYLLFRALYCTELITCCRRRLTGNGEPTHMIEIPSQGTQTPWRLSEESDHGEALIEGATGTHRQPRQNPQARRLVAVVLLHDPEDTGEFHVVQLDARRIVAAVNFTAEVPLELLEAMAEDPMQFPPSGAENE